jgi:achaete-scute complex protein
MVAKRKIAFHSDHHLGGGGGYPLVEAAMPLTPPKTVRRNARERNRVKQIDQGFDKLKSNIPCAAAQKKISRVRILQTAVDYIQHLHAVLNEHESVCSKPIIKQEPLISGGTAGGGGCVSPLTSLPATPSSSHLAVPARSALTPPKPLLQGPSAVGGGSNSMGAPQMMMMPYQNYQHHPFSAGGAPYPPPPPLHHYSHHHFHHHHSPMNVHSPISPYAAASTLLSPQFETASLASSGYYSNNQASPAGLRGSGRDQFFHTPKGVSSSGGLLLSPDGGSGEFSSGCRESLSPSSSSYSDTSLPTPSYPGSQQQQQQTPCTQDPTPSTTFHEEDDDILNSIIQWEKY